MNKACQALLVILALSCFCSTVCKAQIICISCYPQEEEISPNAVNLLLNGSFENPPNAGGNYICPNSNLYNNDIVNWTCSDGGTGTYAQVIQSPNGFGKVVDGAQSIYLGNRYCEICSSTPNDTSCLYQVDCEFFGIPAGYPSNKANYGGTNGVSFSQTVSSLTPGNVYVLEFWTGGEGGLSFFENDGLFGLDLGFGYTYLKCKPTGTQGSILPGMRYLVQFRATQAVHEVKFTNWGHICNTCTEVIIDDASLYNISELNPSYDPCENPGGITIYNYQIDTTICNGDIFSFNGTAYTIPGDYQDTIRNANSDTLNIYSIKLSSNDCFVFEIPSAFSPNGDGKNDFLKPITYGFNPSTYGMKVFNRWGQMIFHTTDYLKGWDGNYKGVGCDIGTYYYIASFKLSQFGRVRKKRGDITLIR